MRRSLLFFIVLVTRIALPQDFPRQQPPAVSVRLTSSAPVEPEKLSLPEYPKLALLARVRGKVTVAVAIDEQGVMKGIVFYEGPNLLRGAVTDAVGGWKFPPNVPGGQVLITLEFSLNCLSESD
jgi:outer membrane biosynthesis protein TonB